MKRTRPVPPTDASDECPNAALGKTRAEGNDELIEAPGRRAKLQARRTRSPQLSGEVYYVVKHSRHTGRPIFGDPFDYATFERLLALALARYRYRLHAFYWAPDAIHLAIQVSDRPIGRFLQWLCGWYSRSVSKHFAKEMLFERSYRALLIEPDHTLLRLIRHLHLRPVSTGAVTDPADSALSSHRAYLGIVGIPWLTTSLALSMLAPSLERRRFEYRRMMQRPEDDPTTLGAGVDRYRQRRPEPFDWPSLMERKVESLQIRAVPVALDWDSVL